MREPSEESRRPGTRPASRPRRWRGGLWLLLLALLASVSLGCRDRKVENRDRPGGPLYQMWDGSGERFVVRDPNGDTSGDANGEPILKWRARSRRIKVYGADLAPVGEVRWKEGADGEAPRVEVRRLAASDWRAVEKRKAGVWEMSERFRIEETGRGWAVFGAGAAWMGRFQRISGDGDDRAWTLMRERDESKRVRVRRDGSKIEAVDGGEMLWSTTGSGDDSELVFLAVGLHDLAPLDRVAVGVLIRELERESSSDDREGDSGG